MLPTVFVCALLSLPTDEIYRVMDAMNYFWFYWGSNIALAVLLFRARHELRHVLLGRLSVASAVGIGLGGAAIALAFQVVLFSALLFAFQEPWTLSHWKFSDIMTVLIIPIREEFFMQVALQTVFQRFRPIGAVVATTIAFVAYHAGGPNFGTGTLPAIGAGIGSLSGTLLTFAVIRQTTKSTGAAIVAHIAFNFALGDMHL